MDMIAWMEDNRLYIKLSGEIEGVYEKCRAVNKAKAEFAARRAAGSADPHAVGLRSQL